MDIDLNLGEIFADRFDYYEAAAERRGMEGKVAIPRRHDDDDRQCCLE